jgi:hypothetical protein
MTGYDGADRRRDDRVEIRFEARLQSGLRFAFDNSASDADEITSAIISDLSGGGASTDAVENLYVGAAVLLEVPLVGWRAATVIWIGGDRAGCRFDVPLTQAELSAAVTKNSFISDAFPGLSAHMSVARGVQSDLLRRTPVDISATVRLGKGAPEV